MIWLVECLLLVVRRAGVAAFDVFVVEDFVPLLFHAEGHLAGVARMDAVVAGRAGEERRRVFHSLFHVVVRRVPS